MAIRSLGSISFAWLFAAIGSGLVLTAIMRRVDTKGSNDSQSSLETKNTESQGADESAWRGPGKPITDADARSLMQREDMEVIDVRGSGINDEDIRTCRSLRTVRVLRLADTGISDLSMLCIERCKKLEILDVAGTKISDTSLLSIAKLEQLHTLVLDYTRVTDRGIGYLDNHGGLEYLSVRSTDVNDELLNTAITWPRIKVIHAHETGVPNDGTEWLRKRGSACRIEKSY